MREAQHVGLARRQPGQRGLQDLDHALVEERDLRHGLLVDAGQRQPDLVRCGPERSQVLQPVALGHRIRHVGHALRPLAQRHGRHERVGAGVDDRRRVAILEAD